MYFCLKGIVTGPRYMYRWRRVIGPDGNRTAAWDDMKTRIEWLGQVGASGRLVAGLWLGYVGCEKASTAPILMCRTASFFACPFGQKDNLS